MRMLFNHAEFVRSVKAGLTAREKHGVRTDSVGGHNLSFIGVSHPDEERVRNEVITVVRRAAREHGGFAMPLRQDTVGVSEFQAGSEEDVLNAFREKLEARLRREREKLPAQSETKATMPPVTVTPVFAPGTKGSQGYLQILLSSGEPLDRTEHLGALKRAINTSKKLFGVEVDGEPDDLKPGQTLNNLVLRAKLGSVWLGEK